MGQCPLHGVTWLSGIMEEWFWCPDIYFWPCWVDFNRIQNFHICTNANNGAGPLHCVTQLPGIVEGWSWYQDIFFWPCWIDLNRFQNSYMYSNNSYNIVLGHFKAQGHFGCPNICFWQCWGFKTVTCTQTPTTPKLTQCMEQVSLPNVRSEFTEWHNRVYHWRMQMFGSIKWYFLELRP